MGLGTWMASPATRAGTYAVIGGAGAIGTALIASVGKIKSLSQSSKQEIANSETQLMGMAGELKQQDSDLLCLSTYEEYSSLFQKLIEAYSELASMFSQLNDAGSIYTPRNAYPWDLEERVLAGNSKNFTVQEWEALRAKRNCPPLLVQLPVQSNLNGSTMGWMKPAAYLAGAFAVGLLGYWMYTQAGGKKKGRK